MDKKPARKAETSAENLIGLLVELRQKLREKKEWQLSDEIRARLNELNIAVEDTKVSGRKHTR